jgi:uncharacterized protein (TIGR02646 family)
VRLVRKGNEPRSLTKERAQGVRYGDLDRATKDDIRASVVSEQAGLCCFCMTSIQAEGRMRIAHLVPQASSSGEELTLVWSNLFGACTGGERTGRASPPSEQHCDVRQGKTTLKVDPTNAQHIASLTYRHPPRASGALHTGYEIHAADADIERDLTVNLNLNLSWLCEDRAEALNVVLERLNVGAGKTFSKEILRRVLDRYETPGPNGRLPPFAGFVGWFLRKRLGLG